MNFLSPYIYIKLATNKETIQCTRWSRTLDGLFVASQWPTPLVLLLKILNGTSAGPMRMVIEAL